MVLVYNRGGRTMVEKLMQANIELSDQVARLLYENSRQSQMILELNQNVKLLQLNSMLMKKNRELRNELHNTIQTIKLGLNNSANSKHNGNGNSSLAIVFVDV